MAIDIGRGADNAPDWEQTGGYTIISTTNPANATGTLDVMEIWCYAHDGAGIKIGTFSGSGTSYTSRDFESIGAVTQGSKQTFTGKNCDVVTGDFIGEYGTAGPGLYSALGSRYYGAAATDWFDGAAHTYTAQGAYDLALYATGIASTAPIPVFMNQYRQRRN